MIWSFAYWRAWAVYYAHNVSSFFREVLYDLTGWNCPQCGMKAPIHKMDCSHVR